VSHHFAALEWSERPRVAVRNLAAGSNAPAHRGFPSGRPMAAKIHPGFKSTE
jgi:hypothetical protein